MRWFRLLILICAMAVLAPQAVAAKGTGIGINGVNLIVNGNAESGPGAADIGNHVAVPGWTVSGGLTVVRYDAGGAPKSDDPGPAARGLNCFIGGANTALSSATQTVKVGTAATVIDASKVIYTLSGYLGGYADQDDNATLVATFRGAGGTSLGKAMIGPVTAAQRGNKTGMLQRSTSGTVPAGTRSIGLVLTMTRTAGSDNDGSADNLALVLHAPEGSVSTPQAPQALTLISPAPNASISGDAAGSAIGFSWTPVPGAKRYYIQVWLTKQGHGDPASSNPPTVNIAGVSAVPSYALSVPDPLFNGVYSWRVAALNGAGSLIGDWTPASSFSIALAA